MKMASQKGSVSTGKPWTSTQAYVFAVICLVVGVAVGYFLRGSGSPVATAPEQTSPASPASAAMGGGMGQVTPEQLRGMADKQAAPVLAQLKNSPNDPTLLAHAGNIYFDAQQFPEAVNYYQKSLAIDGKNTDVRTDLGTAMWSMGNADGAIEEFNKALQHQPDKGTALFNLGIVKWQGKMDIPGALAAWNQLLKTNPNYPDRAKVEELVAQVQQHSKIAPGTTTSKPAN
jgi:cytochrome c-type biogenesis protein CcmH/NrfG